MKIQGSCHRTLIDAGVPYAIGSHGPTNPFLNIMFATLHPARHSYERAPRTDSIYDLIGDQIRRLETEPIENLAPIRNPGIE